MCFLSEWHVAPTYDKWLADTIGAEMHCNGMLSKWQITPLTQISLQTYLVMASYAISGNPDISITMED